MRKLFLVIMIAIAMMSACSENNDNPASEKSESGTKIKKDYVKDNYDIVNKHLNSKEVKDICYISGDKNIIYYTTQDNQLINAESNSENINIKKIYDSDDLKRLIFGKNVFANENKKTIYCSSNNTDGSQSLLSMDMETGQIQDLLKGIDIFAEYTPNYYFNYHNGVLLFQLRKKTNKYDYPIKYWGLIDTNNNQANLLDVEEIFDIPLVKGYKDMFVIGDNKIMIVVHNGDMINLFFTDFTGKIIKTVNYIDIRSSQMQSGMSACHVSPDGKYLLFSWQQTPITLVLFDIENTTEYVVLNGSGKIRNYSGWLNNETFIYQTIDSENKKEIKTIDVNDFINNY